MANQVNRITKQNKKKINLNEYEKYNGKGKIHLYCLGNGQAMNLINSKENFEKWLHQFLM